jgi:maleamate amidohydrolase
MPPDLLEMARRYTRKVFVGPAPALLAIDLYDVVYRGGAKPPQEIYKENPGTCGVYAWEAIEPTKRLFASARRARLPIFYSTMDVRTDSRPLDVWATRGSGPRHANPADFVIRPEFKPQPGDIIIEKQRASVFYGTPIAAHLTQLGVRTLIICGESTSGCVRATAVEAQEAGYHVVLVEECCYDRNIISHKVNLFDLHHKYVDVLHVDDVVTHLDALQSGDQTK